MTPTEFFDRLKGCQLSKHLSKKQQNILRDARRDGRFPTVSIIIALDCYFEPNDIRDVLEQKIEYGKIRQDHVQLAEAYLEKLARDGAFKGRSRKRELSTRAWLARAWELDAQKWAEGANDQMV